MLDIAGVASLDDVVLADILAEVAASLERDHIIDSIVDTRMLDLIGDLANETFSEPVDETALDYAEPCRVRREPAVAVEGDEVWFRYPALDGGLFEFLIGDFTPDRRRELTARACIEAKDHDETLYLDEPNLVRQIDKIIRYGIQDSCMTNKMRLLDTKIGLYELKGYSGVDREMVYVLVRAPLEIVLLFSFKGHQGSGNIHSEIHRARPLAKIAAELLHELHDHL